MEFFVPGNPVAQPRPRVYRGKGGVRTVSNTAAVAAFKAAVQLFARQAHRGEPLACPVWANLLFLMRRAKRGVRPGRQWHVCRPDLDNAIKSVLDACNGILYEDDAQICYLEAGKRIAAAGEEPGVWVRIVAAEE